MSGDSRRRWVIGLGLALMLAAIFAYMASLDDTDPQALPAAVEDADHPAP